MARLSLPLADLKDEYTAVVVGSGYGGGIAASRLARAGQNVCVLERGKEFQPGEYPDTAFEALAQMQADSPLGKVGSPTGLYDFRMNDDINVFLGCGLGGTSLVNANVSVKAEKRVFEDTWPAMIRAEAGEPNSWLNEGYRRAEDMLKPVPFPQDWPTPRKLLALEKSALHLGEKFHRPPINVTFQDGLNHVGVEQKACVLCGDCVTGCNYAAKNTVLMNYLPDAKNHGAQIFTEVGVRRVARKNGRWAVYFQPIGVGRERFGAPEPFVLADIVILAAGTLGSTEILLRSREQGLRLSGQLGERFTGNGDVLGFAYNNAQAIDGIGYGHLGREKIQKKASRVGPTITGIVDAREKARLEDGMVIEEGAIPAALAAALPAVFAAAAAAFGKTTGRGIADTAGALARELESWTRGAYHGALHNTQTFLVMAHDDGKGRMVLKDGRLRVEWKGVGSQPIFETINQRLRQAAQATSGIYIKNPTWGMFTNNSLVTVHPLGGCVMAEDASQGVVNHKGQVFASDSGDQVHPGLYVCDGAVLPRSVGVNPLLTICALAERTCRHLAADRGWTIPYQLPSAPPAGSGGTGRRPLGVRFTETMKGYFSTKIKGDYEKAAEQGKKEGAELQFNLTIESDDLERTMREDDHAARMSGTVTAKGLAQDGASVTFVVSDGHFNFFVKNSEQANTHNMWYRMKLTAADGRRLYFEGFKVIRDDPGLDLWPDTTTLYVTLREGHDASGEILGRGVLIIKPEDFLKQMTTMEITHAESVAARAFAQLRFGRFFLGFLYDTYREWAAARLA